MSESKTLTGKITATLVEGESKRYIYVEGKAYEITISGDTTIGSIDFKSNSDLRNNILQEDVLKAAIGTFIRERNVVPKNFSINYSADYLTS